MRNGTAPPIDEVQKAEAEKRYAEFWNDNPPTGD